ncbi:surfeit locus protein 5 subunit 22 of mediator complex-domain-containing protein [Lipomyces arxii]|uniref:surfeit locus protein 5 subunit 22 of mediator complex-domain-containing protein n=1 Tax=Lipomyces arxii TaxID=56418 RepID=UPI0034CE368D
MRPRFALGLSKPPARQPEFVQQLIWTMSAVTTAQQTHHRVNLINQRITEATSTILNEYSSILELAKVAGKDRATTASESYQIECHTTSIVRAVEDLLMVSRSLKELWILGQVSSSVRKNEEQASE